MCIWSMAVLTSEDCAPAAAPAAAAAAGAAGAGAADVCGSRRFKSNQNQ